MPFLFGKVVLQVPRSGQTGQRYAQILAALTVDPPASPQVFVDKSMAVFDSQSCLANAVRPVYNRYNARIFKSDDFPQSAQLSAATHEMFVVPVEVTVGLEHSV